MKPVSLTLLPVFGVASLFVLLAATILAGYVLALAIFFALWFIVLQSIQLEYLHCLLNRDVQEPPLPADDAVPEDPAAAGRPASTSAR